MKMHYTANYILNPAHKVTINLIGAGGTGSQVLSGLARLHQALLAINHPGIHVYVWDDDVVTDANVGRQLFSPADIGMNKALCLVTRINRFFGYEWEGRAELYQPNCDNANITISCVDSVQSRLLINKAFVDKRGFSRLEPMKKPYYWMDFGNMQKTGQVVIGTVLSIVQPKKSQYQLVASLPTVVKKFKQLKKVKEEDQGPSCSLAEALHKQDLYINSTLANLGLNLLWRLFKDAHLTIQGCFLNLDTMTVNPMKL